MNLTQREIMRWVASKAEAYLRSGASPDGYTAMQDAKAEAEISLVGWTSGVGSIAMLTLLLLFDMAPDKQDADKLHHVHVALDY